MGAIPLIAPYDGRLADGAARPKAVAHLVAGTPVPRDHQHPYRVRVLANNWWWIGHRSGKESCNYQPHGSRRPSARLTTTRRRRRRPSGGDTVGPWMKRGSPEKGGAAMATSGQERAGSRLTAAVLLAVGLAGCATSPQTLPGDDAPSATPGQTSEPAPQGSGADPHIAAAPTSSAERFWLSLSHEESEGTRLTNLDVTEPEVTVTVVALNDGAVVAERDPWGGAALRFPAASADPHPPRAIVRVVHAGEHDPLAPGLADFGFGADFVLDADTQGSQVGDGHNLIQRGLASDPSQIKIEVDGARPSCRVQGPSGLVELKLTQRVAPGEWYRARCSRSAGTIRFTLSSIDAASVSEFETVTAEADVGDLRWKQGTPLSVGGKLSAGGEVIRRATDQFNGVVSGPFLQIDG